jgi:uncharacterized protein (DUF983 family)
MTLIFPPSLASGASPSGTGGRRPLITGLMRGFGRTCPQCSASRLFRGYLNPVESCAGCGLDVTRFRADDAPPYFTIFLVGHILGPAMLLTESHFHPAVWVHMAIWLPLAVIMTLGLLPCIKGAVIGAQWALKIKS